MLWCSFSVLFSGEPDTTRVPLILPRRQDKNHRGTVSVALWTRVCSFPVLAGALLDGPPASAAIILPR